MGKAEREAVNAGSGLERREVLLLGADYPENVADGYARGHQPQQGAESGIECQANAQPEVEYGQGEDEEEYVSNDFHFIRSLFCPSDWSTPV